MKALAIFFAITTLGLGTVCVLQHFRLNEMQTELAGIRSEAAQQSEQLKESEVKQTRAEEQVRELTSQADELTAQLAARASSESNLVANAAAAAIADTNRPPAEGAAKSDKESGTAGFGKMLGKMMQDPAMKKMIQSQQRQMMDQLYGPLIKQWGLTPEEADKFKNLLSENTMKATEKAASMFGDLSSTNHAETAAAMAEQQKALDDQLKEMLGDTRFAQYKEYQETAGERMQLNNFRQQNAGSDYPITDIQADQLLAFMREEKKAAAANGQVVPGNNQNSANFQAMLSGDQMEKMMQTQQEINQRVYERATTVLSPAQLESFGTYQTNQLQMLRLGMDMARKLFVPDKSGAGSTAGTPSSGP